MQISFGSPPDSADDIHIQSYLDSFDCKKKIGSSIVNSIFMWKNQDIRPSYSIEFVKVY